MREDEKKSESAHTCAKKRRKKRNCEVVAQGEILTISTLSLKDPLSYIRKECRRRRWKCSYEGEKKFLLVF